MPDSAADKFEFETLREWVRAPEMESVAESARRFASGLGERAEGSEVSGSDDICDTESCDVSGGIETNGKIWSWRHEYTII